MGARSIESCVGTLDTLIVALCADFERREERCEDRRVAMEFKYLNARMLDAAAEIVGPRYAAIIIYEIGNRIGYASSAIPDISESTYKRRKMAVKTAIAKKLYLMK